MGNNPLYIRFGVHKDREILRALRQSIRGIVVPAHILAYSPDATVAAVQYVDRSYFVDPMAYIFTKSNIGSYLRPDKKTGYEKFKPSIDKLAKLYKLSELFEARSYGPLELKDFDSNFIDSFSKNVYEVQMNGIDKQKESAFSRYNDLLAKLGETKVVEKLSTNQLPEFIVPPYFHFSSINDPWLNINIALAKATSKISQKNVLPVLCTNAESLDERLLTEFKGFDRIILWLQDLDEVETSGSKSKQLAKLKQYYNFVRACNRNNIKPICLYGSYFSALLTKYGLDGLCHGVVYGESKTVAARVGGGAPPIRFYIRKLHRFFGVPEAIALFNNYPDLIENEDRRTMSLMRNGSQDLLMFNDDSTLAHKQFIQSREFELYEIASLSNEELIKELSETYKTYNPLPKTITSTDLEYLHNWYTTLETSS